MSSDKQEGAAKDGKRSEQGKSAADYYKLKRKDK